MKGVASPRAAIATAAADVVATSCPRCGAPLDFAEASNAVRCRHCSVVLLVTGRRRVLSYAIAPRVAAAEARTLAGFARPATRGASRLGEPRLVLVPYYRLAAEEVYWQRKQVSAPRPTRLDSFQDLGETMGGFAGAVAYEREARVELELVGRRIERNFLACEAHGLASWSLGVRPTVLRLELFQRDVLERQATVLRPTIAHEAALAHALEPSSEIRLLHRDVLRAVLSVVYFPLWSVAARGSSGASLTVVDAVSGTVVARDADPSALDGAAAPAAAPDRVLGFRPLTCPNCAWDLPVRPDDVVFHCTSCERTWELAGEELEPIPSDVVVPAPAAPGVRVAGPACHLPVWEVRGGATVTRGVGARATVPERLYAPAFRWRALKGLCDLGARLSRRAPDVEAEPTKAVPLVGCSLDRADAVTLARLIALRLVAPHEARASRAEPLPEVELRPRALRLLWLPFAGDAYSLRESFTGSALPRRAVEELLGSSA